MKPSKELVQQWSSDAHQHACRSPMSFQQEYVLKFAELAAAWGAQQSLDGKRWSQLWSMVDEGNASVVIYGLVDSINTGLEINDGGSLTYEVDAAMKGEQQ